MTHYLLTIMLLLLGCGNPDTPPASKPAETSVADTTIADTAVAKTSVADTTVAAPRDSMSSAAFVMSLQVYKVGIIRKGANWSADAPAKLQEMAKKNAEPWRQAIIDGSLVGVARVVDPAEIVSVLFFKKQTDEEMKAMAANAPAVKAGLVKAEVQEVWGTKGLGMGLPDKAAADSTMTAKKETYYMVYTTKGKNWSADSESPETRKATDEQIQYLYGLHKGGMMKYFGVFTDMAQTIRGFGIFKTATEKEALDLMAKSPSVQKGMLDAGVKTVEIAEGTLK